MEFLTQNQSLLYRTEPVVENVTGILLAGGKSKRMGRDKRFIEYGGRSLISIAVGRLRNLVDELLIVTAQPEDLGIDDATVVADVSYGNGPLMGIYSGLIKTNNSYVVVNPVDTPNIPEEFLEFMINISCGYDVVMPRWGNRLEPLIAVYSRNAIPVIERIITDGSKPAPHLLASPENGLKINIVKENEIEEFGNPEILFANINFPEDLPLRKTL